MSHLTSSDGADEALVNDINMTPLIDVMLVLLIIFIITLPVITQSVKVALPVTEGQPASPEPQVFSVSIDAEGAVWWNEERVNEAMLEQHLAQAAALQPTPTVRVLADRQVRYQYVAKVLSAAQQHGIESIDLATQAPAGQ